jgi:hypothetical protein
VAAHGIYRANTPERRQKRRVFLDDLKATRRFIFPPDQFSAAVLAVKREANAARKLAPVPLGLQSG